MPEEGGLPGDPSTGGTNRNPSDPSGGYPGISWSDWTTREFLKWVDARNGAPLFGGVGAGGSTGAGGYKGIPFLPTGGNNMGDLPNAPYPNQPGNPNAPGINQFRSPAGPNQTFDRNHFPGWTPLDPTRLPGWTDIPAYDFPALMQQFMQMGKPAGGGGGGGRGGQNDAAGGFLQNLFQGGGQNFGDLDPALLATISGLQGQNTGEYGDLTSFIRSQGGDLLSYLMGSGGDPGGGSGRFSMGGGGGGGYNIPDFASLYGQIPEFDAGNIDVGLRSLPPEVLAELQTMQDAELGGVEQMRQSVTDQMTAQLFGQGIERSSVAGEAIGRASTGLEQNLLQARAQGAQRKLGLMTDESQRRLQADLATQATRLGGYQTRVGSATDLEKAHIGANAQIQSASIGASAAAASSYASSQSALQAARMNTLASIFDTQVKGLSSAYGDRSGVANNFGNIFGNLAMGDQKAEIDKMLGIGGLANDRITANKQAAIAGANARNAAAAQQQDAFLKFLGFQEGVAGRLQEGLMGISGQDLQRFLGQTNANAQIESAKAAGKKSQSNDWMQLIGTLASAYAMYASDIRLKEDIEPISNGHMITEDDILKLVPFTYRYKHIPDHTKHVGIMAQDLLHICPEAVIEDPVSKYLMVDYRKLCVALILGYRQLAKERSK